ncbi:hypothetical protein M3Y97_01140900 [Aphelenchoides bicaudatus]|nr:hypothetical protein M3Y97_01140900 [Aphelenchoides bicaudatus]
MESDYVDGQQRRINELQTRCQRLEQLLRDKTTAENANQQLRNSLESQIQFLQEENVRLTNETSNQQKVDQCYECVKQGNNAIKPHINECIRIRNGGLVGFTVEELLGVVDKCYESAVAKMSDCEV